MLSSRGADVELDSIGTPNQSDAKLDDTIRAIVEAGYLDHILLSHDAGWHNPGRPDGLPDHGFRGYTALTKEFYPAMFAPGISKEQIQHITINNPARAFAC